MKAMIELVNKSLKEVELMSKADKMFADLGYVRDGHAVMTYRNGNITLMFDVDDNIYTLSEYFPSQYRSASVSTNIKLHLAIHEKMEEMGWLNEQSI